MTEKKGGNESEHTSGICLRPAVPGIGEMLEMLGGKKYEANEGESGS